jgi:ABC-type transporter Mla MlaB component/DNA-directed RNA polymerase subunit RPC12/RpoP
VTTSLHCQVIPGPDRTKISLAGAIDERAELDIIVDQIPPRAAVTIDLSQISRISSMGVRVWIVFIDKLKAHSMPVDLEGCSVVIVRQMNMITQFRGHAAVKSAYAPYYCASCNKEQLRLIDLGTEVTPQLRAMMLCPTCGSKIDLDEEEELYSELQSIAVDERGGGGGGGGGGGSGGQQQR